MPADRLSRTQFLRLAALSATALVMPSVAFADDNEITRDMILNDPETPTGGNPNGDLTIVDFFDYNCPYCKATVLHERYSARNNKMQIL